MDGSELPAEVQSKHDLLKIEGPGKHELPETIEDVAARLKGDPHSNFYFEVLKIWFLLLRGFNQVRLIIASYFIIFS